MTFFRWFKIGSVASLIACGIGWGLLLVVAPLMPDRTIEVKAAQLDRNFANKLVTLEVVSAKAVVKNAPVKCETSAVYALNIKGARIPVYAVVPADSKLKTEIVKASAEPRFFEGVLNNSKCGKFRVLKLNAIHAQKSAH